MKLEKKTIAFDFSKKNENQYNYESTNPIPKKSKFFFNILKKFSFFSASTILISSFLKLNNVDFQQQISFIQNKNFNSSILTFLSILMFLKMVSELMNYAIDGKTLDKKFSSIWMPFQYIILMTLFLPDANNHQSLFSSFLVFMIEKLQHFF